MSFDLGSIRCDSRTTNHINQSLELLYELKKTQSNASFTNQKYEEKEEKIIEECLLTRSNSKKKRNHKAESICNSDSSNPKVEIKSLDNAEIDEKTQRVRSKSNAIQKRKSFTRIRSESILEKKAPLSSVDWVSEGEIKGVYVAENISFAKEYSKLTDSRKIKKHDDELIKNIKQYQFPDNIQINKNIIVSEANSFLVSQIKEQFLEEVSGPERMHAIFQKTFLTKSAILKRLRACYRILELHSQKHKCMTLFTKTLRNALEELLQKDKTLSSFLSCVVKINLKEYPLSEEKKDKIKKINEKIQLVLNRVFGEDFETQTQVLSILSEFNSKNVIMGKTTQIFEIFKMTVIEESGQGT